MNKGDIVRLKQPFRPDPSYPMAYSYGVVVGLIAVENDGNQSGQSSQLNEVILQLYEPESSVFYTDEFGAQPMFYFCVSELEL